MTNEHKKKCIQKKIKRKIVAAAVMHIGLNYDTSSKIREFMRA